MQLLHILVDESLGVNEKSFELPPPDRPPHHVCLSEAVQIGVSDEQKYKGLMKVASKASV